MKKLPIVLLVASCCISFPCGAKKGGKKAKNSAAIRKYIIGSMIVVTITGVLGTTYWYKSHTRTKNIAQRGGRSQINSSETQDYQSLITGDEEVTEQEIRRIVNEYGEDLEEALQGAASKGDAKAVSVIIEHGQPTKDLIRETLWSASKIIGKKDVVRAIILKGKLSIGTMGMALWNAAEINGNSEVVSVIIEHGKLNKDDILEAINKSADEDIKKLLQNKLDEISKNVSS